MIIVNRERIRTVSKSSGYALLISKADSRQRYSKLAGRLQAGANNILSMLFLGLNFMDNFRKHMSEAFIATLVVLVTCVQQDLSGSQPNFLINVSDI